MTILDCLIQNAGPHFQRTFADEPLLERLRIAATDPVSDKEVKDKCAILFAQWHHSYKATPGLERIASLYQQLPKRKKPRSQSQSKVLRETEADPFEDGDDASSTTSAPTKDGTSKSSDPKPSATATSLRPAALSPAPNLVSKAKRDKKDGRRKAFNLDKEKPQMLQTIASSSVASTNLLNALKLINREHQRVSEDNEAVKRFETCKLLRRQVLRYIQNVESEQWLGSLLHANDELVTALMAFEVLDKSVDDDSDSEGEGFTNDDSGSKSPNRNDVAGAFVGLQIGERRPPEVRRSSKPSISGSIIPPTTFGNRKREPLDESDEEDDLEEEDENDPFADRNAVNTPKVEPKNLKW